MRIEIIAIGNKIPDWVQSGFADYQRRMPPYLELILTHHNNVKAVKQLSVEQRKQEEAVKLLKSTQRSDHVVALDVKGKSVSSEQLAVILNDWQQLGTNIKIIIGGADGLDQTCLQRANQRLSLSVLTLPHQLVKLVIAEQLYRAHCINIGHPYHRE